MERIEGLLTVKQAMAALNASRATIRKWGDTGFLHCIRTPSGERRFPSTALYEIIDRGAVGGEE